MKEIQKAFDIYTCKYEDFGMQPIDRETAKVVAFIFKRLLGAFPSIKYTSDTVKQLDSVRAEYCFSLMRHKVVDVSVINRAIDRLIDLGGTFLPTAGQLASVCKDIMHEDKQRRRSEEDRRYIREIINAELERERETQ